MVKAIHIIDSNGYAIMNFTVENENVGDIVQVISDSIDKQKEKEEFIITVRNTTNSQSIN